MKNTATATGTPPTGPAVKDVSDSGDELVDTNADPDTDPTNDHVFNSLKFKLK